MTPPLIIANWKSYKTEKEAKLWLTIFKEHRELLLSKTVMLLAPYTCLSSLKKEIDALGLPIVLGAQDISPFSEGAYTGEINALQIREFASYVLIGHSERRRLLLESDELISKKVAMAKKEGLEVLLCVQDIETPIPEGVTMVAYEPVSAIGTGHPDTPENAASVITKIKQKGISYGIYGGSVTAENVRSFTEHVSDGVLVGSASLDPRNFLAIINHA